MERSHPRRTLVVWDVLAAVEFPRFRYRCFHPLTVDSQTVEPECDVQRFGRVLHEWQTPDDDAQHAVEIDQQGYLMGAVGELKLESSVSEMWKRLHIFHEGGDVETEVQRFITDAQTSSVVFAFPRTERRLTEHCYQEAASQR